MNFSDVHTHTEARSVWEETCSYISLGGLPCHLTESFNPCSCLAPLRCDCAEKATDFPFGWYYPNTVWVTPSRSEPLSNPSYCGDENSLQQPQVFPLILVSPDGKGQELSPPPTSQPEKQTQNQPLLSTQLLRGLLLLSHFQAKSPVSQRPRRGSWRQCPVNPLRRDNTVSLL